MDKKQFKKLLGDIWYFIWDDDSIWSWIANIILAFIIIKFMVYPIIGLVFTTSYPIVAVVSGSMTHDGSFNDWWQSTAICENTQCTQEQYYAELDISKEIFRDFRFRNGFNKGDIMLLKGSDPQNIKSGDVIVFKSNRPDPIIHRVVQDWEQNNIYYYKTKGDHNSQSYPSLGEDNISQDRVLGKAILRIPYLGYIKILFVKIIAEPYCQLTKNTFPCR